MNPTTAWVMPLKRPSPIPTPCSVAAPLLAARDDLCNPIVLSARRDAPIAIPGGLCHMRIVIGWSGGMVMRCRSRAFGLAAACLLGWILAGCAVAQPGQPAVGV